MSTQHNYLDTPTSKSCRPANGPASSRRSLFYSLSLSLSLSLSIGLADATYVETCFACQPQVTPIHAAEMHGTTTDLWWSLFAREMTEYTLYEW